MGHVVVTNEPAEILLKDAISEPIAEFIDQRIQSRFGGIGLPTTVKDLNESITNLCNLVAVEIHMRDTIVITNNTGVCRLPGLAVSNGIVHLLFDLTHDLL